MDLRQLRYFISVAEHRSFTKAASTLHIAQPALSIAIKKLEASVGLPLFDRNERQVHLTHEGEVLLPHAYRILQHVEDASTEMAELRGLQKGEVRVGVPGMLGSYFFPSLLMGFKSKYPDLTLIVVEAGTQSIRQMLLDGELDIGVIHSQDVPATLETTHLISSQMVAVTSKDHPLADVKSMSFDDFFKEELVMFKKGYFHREFIDRICVERKITPHLSFETNLLAMILNIVRHGFAITALLEMVTEYEPSLVPIPFEEPVILDIAMAWRKHGYLSLADRAFIDFIQQNK
ncbi:LysR family transcriptional regulator [Enterovibrio norvegicus]|uniref:DNA-binding transcriptional regulator, LysR family n=2 Tax=Enterovibrio norvegicus TaxID=188144 RepID=A0A1I5JXX7_9GAMM|nr:LysR substrate-binding domain-containing protein [Enterovibrio norvegicus]MCC4797274.1 LysR family transcriptional regulator [Enterovibrio norvegicus]OEE60022.1 LysR family transcriptional regulator [Enterovibrio norvegicus]OEF49571.1 LysR family transcriptional regulator [Enterovibrio norvegicus]OEF58335.1 LysR family transcriptional regulator [Enterovibrio norvegicus]PMH72264.1 LysR family transcriptional regulator [Enterovibrio norvegicus]